MKSFIYLSCCLIASNAFAQANSVVPKNDPDNPRTVEVNNTSGLRSALQSAQPGDVIFLRNGRYDGPLEISANGTIDNPIIIRGESQAGVEVVQATSDWPAYNSSTKSQWQCWDKDANVTLRGSNVYLEDLTVIGGDLGVKLRARASQTGVVIRNTRITNAYCGISLWEDSHSKHYICDNRIEGRMSQDDRIQSNQTNFDGKKGWGVEGIMFNGNDLTVCHNTLSGFGDTIDNHPLFQTRNLDVYGNDILFGADDGIEIDGDTRNARVFGNRVANSGTGISVQPDISNPGPYYIFRNVIYNVGLSYLEGSVLDVSLPFKFKNNADNIYLYHNTSVRAGPAWDGVGQNGIVDEENNLILGTTESYRLPIFDPADPILASGTRDWETFRQAGRLALASGSMAIDAGTNVPGYSDGAVNAPDLGAYEFGQVIPDYGVRGTVPAPDKRPRPPSDLVTD